MRVLHVNAVGNVGGAGRAAFRLHHGLRRLGYESTILAGHRAGPEAGIEHLRESTRPVRSAFADAVDRVGALADQCLGSGPWTWRDSWLMTQLARFQRADVVNLHNLHGGYFNVRALAELSRHKPLVWTLHDMWALTGHCAYAYDCTRWRTGCHHCPLLRASGRRLVEPAPTLFDRTRSVWETKRRVYRSTPLHVVAPSRWLRRCIEESILAGAASVHYIPYGIDLDLYRPVEQARARYELGLPTTAKVILFSADGIANRRKGLTYVVEALHRLPDVADIRLLITGDASALTPVASPLRVHSLGYVVDDAVQCLAFNAADICVSPTLADNLPLVLLESLACGTPVVAFDVGGVSDIVHHLRTGYLARRRDTQDLSHGVRLLLNDDGLRRRVSETCRSVAESHFPLELQASRYADLYRSMIDRADRGRGDG